MTTVYLVRHAEAEGNVYRRSQGQYDSLLTERAYLQLPYLAARFQNKPIDCVFSSDLFRARRTAQAIADTHGLPVEQRAVLREINMGDWEDVPWAYLPLRYPAEYAAWREKPWASCPPHGESVMQAGERMLSGVRQIVAEHRDQTIVVVTHGSAIRGALTIAHGWTPTEMEKIGWGDNTCVAKLLFATPEQVEVVYENDASHLPPAVSTFSSIGWKNNKKEPESEQIWFRPVDPENEEDAAALVRFFREIYQNAYGTDRNIRPAEIVQMARSIRAIAPEAVTFGIRGAAERVALVCLDARQNDPVNIGLVGGFCIDAKYRGAGLSQQILGQAISVYRARGKEYLLAHVGVDNERAKGFYRKFGFSQEGTFQNENGDHYCMIKRIKVD